MKTIDRKVKDEVCAFEDKIKDKLKILNLVVDELRQQVNVLKEQYHDVVVDIQTIVERLDILDDKVFSIN